MYRAWGVLLKPNQDKTHSKQPNRRLGRVHKKNCFLYFGEGNLKTKMPNGWKWLNNGDLLPHLHNRLWTNEEDNNGSEFDWEIKAPQGRLTRSVNLTPWASPEPPPPPF